MIEVIVVIALVLIVLVMSTLGSVLLAGLFLSKLDRVARVFVAAIAGPILIIVPAVILGGMNDPNGLFEGVIVLGLIGAVAAVVVGWPVAHFATKSLDRLMKFDLETFK